jgi:hypothetical protein
MRMTLEMSEGREFKGAAELPSLEKASRDRL